MRFQVKYGSHNFVYLLFLTVPLSALVPSLGYLYDLMSRSITPEPSFEYLSDLISKSRTPDLNSGYMCDFILYPKPTNLEIKAS